MSKPFFTYQIVLALIFFISALPSKSFSQNDLDRLPELQKKLNVYQKKSGKLNEKVTISLNGSIQEMVGFLAESTQLNISVDPTIKANVSNTFTDASTRDILLYLCDAYELDLKFTGSIIQLIPYRPTPKENAPKLLDINFRQDLLTLNLNNDTLSQVVKNISKLTKQNIAVEPSLRNKKVNGFINNLATEDALEQLALNNDLKVEKKDGRYMILGVVKDQASQQQRTKSGNQPELEVKNLLVKKTSAGKVDVNALNVPLLDVIKETAIQLQENYYLLPEQNLVSLRSPNDPSFRSTGQSSGLKSASQTPISIQVKNANFKEVLDQICQASNYSYSIENGVFIIGERRAEGLRKTTVLPLKYRSARGVLEHIPQDLSTGVSIDTLMELNSLILSGSEKNIIEIDSFIRSIDKLVPVILIELMIIDVQTNTLRELGVEAGVIPGGKDPGGVVAGSGPGSGGGIDFTFSPNAINRVLDILSGRNIINLGQVNNNFYLNLKAVEEQGFIEIKSTPKLSTLNSHPANLSIGQKRYYQEQQVNFPGRDNPIPVQSNIYQEIEANLNIDITPVVSGDEQVTLEIYFEQSEFLDEPDPFAPPPQVSRKFESMIRVKNGEMIVLGGLERASDADLKRGVPFLSRIPLIGWLFGRKKKSKSNNKLMVLVKPTIIN